MTRIERFGRLLSLAIPGKEEAFPAMPQQPCHWCDGYVACFHRLGILGKWDFVKICECPKFQEHQAEYQEFFKSYHHIDERWMNAVFYRFPILHYLSSDFGVFFIPKNPDTSLIINLFQAAFPGDRKWKVQTDLIVPMLHRHNSWKAVEVALILKASTY